MLYHSAAKKLWCASRTKLLPTSPFFLGVIRYYKSEFFDTELDEARILLPHAVLWSESGPYVNTRVGVHSARSTESNARGPRNPLSVRFLKHGKHTPRILLLVVLMKCRLCRSRHLPRIASLLPHGPAPQPHHYFSPATSLRVL